MYRSFLKPLSDKLIALTLVILASPVFVILFLLLSIANKGSAFFTQRRPGHNGLIFRLIKFKTMTDEKDSSGKLLPDAKRLTPIGKFIRSTSLDELPQLINVIKGDMSLIGPRPLLERYQQLYSSRQARRHEVKPGITGWAQVNGRNAISWEDKFEMDVWYVEHQNFWLDLKILGLTIVRVLKRADINAGGTATMPAFKGNQTVKE